MLNVKRTFFLTQKEVDTLITVTGNAYITAHAPHYELADSTIVYAQMSNGDLFYKSIEE